MNIHQTKDTLSVAEAVKKVLAPDVQLEKKISETEIAPADKAAHDDHVVDKKKNPESEKQTEEIVTEDVTDFRGFKSKDKLVKFTSMAKKLKIKPVGNPIIMKRMGTDYHVQGFSGKVKDIEKAIKVAVEIEKGTIESVDFTKEGNEFTAAAAKAKLAGKDEFEFDGKKYPVEIGQDAAEKILGKKEEVEIEESVEVEESADLEEAVKPEVFVKGGDTKVTKREVDGMLSKIFINTKLAKQVEDSEAYQAGEKGKGKKKNPYKKDTADFQLYELGVQSSQAS